MKDKLKSLLALILPSLAAFLFADLTAEVWVESMANLAGIVFLIPIIGEAIKTRWNLKDHVLFAGIKTMKAITWALAIGLTYVSWFVGWGFTASEWYVVGAFGFGGGLVANEYFTLETVKLLLSAIFKK